MAAPRYDGDRVALTVNGMPWVWDLVAGNLELYGQHSVAFGTLNSLERLISPLRREIGDDLFRLLIALSAREGAEVYYESLISGYGSDFEAGFLAWGEAVAIGEQLLVHGDDQLARWLGKLGGQTDRTEQVADFRVRHQVGADALPQVVE